MIYLKNLSVWYENVQALRDVSLDISPGECVLVTGPSGCGKSTLARVLCGLIPQAIPAQIEGEVEIAGIDTRVCPIPEIAQKIGMVFQRPASQLFHLKVEDEVAFGPRNLGCSEEEVRERTDWALLATGMDDLRRSNTRELSGGQKQCLAIASALAMRPQILVLDEPTASLDVPNTRRVIETLAELNKNIGMTIVLIEHRLAEAAQLAKHVILMEDGRIVLDGEPGTVFGNFDLRKRLGLRRPTEEASLSWEELIQPDDDFTDGRQPLLSINPLSSGFNGQAIIEDIQLKLYPGDFVALVGDNGAGKTTLALTAAGLLKPQTGNVSFLNGEKPRPGLDVALLFQDPEEQLFTDSVNEEVEFAAKNYDRFNLEEHKQTLQEADLWGLRDRRPQALSVGQQQRTTLAACLSLRPRLLILDEPTLGQDWGHLQRMMNYLKMLNGQGMTILLISHDYKLVHRYARRVIIMKKGRIERIGKIDLAFQKDREF